MARNIRVENRRGFEQMLKAFRKKSCTILQEVKARKFYESPSEKRRRELRQRERDKRIAESLEEKRRNHPTVASAVHRF